MNGRYAFGNQPGIAQWNMVRFAECLLPLINSNMQKAAEQIQPILEKFPVMFDNAWMNMLGRKIGLETIDAPDRKLIRELLSLMTANRADYTNTMDLLTGIITVAAMNKGERENSYSADPAGIQPGSPEKEKLSDAGLDEWFVRWQNRLVQENKSAEDISFLMRSHNPAVIPRNHHMEEVLEQSVLTGSSDAANQYLEVLRRPYQNMENTRHYQKPPADNSGNYMTFCGT